MGTQWKHSKSKDEGKDQELIQSSTTHYPGHHIGKWQKTQENITYKRTKNISICLVTPTPITTKVFMRKQEIHDN